MGTVDNIDFYRLHVCTSCEGDFGQDPLIEKIQTTVVPVILKDEIFRAKLSALKEKYRDGFIEIPSALYFDAGKTDFYSICLNVGLLNVSPDLPKSSTAETQVRNLALKIVCAFQKLRETADIQVKVQYCTENTGDLESVGDTDQKDYREVVASLKSMKI